MRDLPRVSLVVVSRGRPVELRRLLVSLRFLQYPDFEVVVVSSVNPTTSYPGILPVGRIKFVPFDEPNISAARNLGIGAASGEIIAFCDDDAVPEPTWLDNLIGPFMQPDVAAAGGYVRGRNGISFQWTGRRFDRYGSSFALDIKGDDPAVLAGTAEQGIKTEGTNCAFRRQVLVDLGGFDENFRYYLDETDLNYRIGLAGWKTVIVPLAQVHHGFAESSTRGRNRAPKSLFEIGASKAWFCKKHGDVDQTARKLSGFRAGQRRRLIDFMVRGELSPFDVPRLERSLEEGIAEGLNRREETSDSILTLQSENYLPFSDKQPKVKLLAVACRTRNWRKAASEVADEVAKGNSVTVFRLSLTSMFHRLIFHADGYWVQTGGIFGRSTRGNRLFKLATLKSRVGEEVKRLIKVRPLEEIRWF